MIVRINRGGMVTIFPEGPVPHFALVVFLRGAVSNSLHAADDDVRASVFDQKMDVVGSHHVVEHGQADAFLRLKEPMNVTAPDRV